MTKIFENYAFSKKMIIIYIKNKKGVLKNAKYNKL